LFELTDILNGRNKNAVWRFYFRMKRRRKKSKKLASASFLLFFTDILSMKGQTSGEFSQYARGANELTCDDL